MKDKYGPALPRGTKFEIAKPTGDYAHEKSPKTAHAVDFKVPIGTEVIAVKGGEVIETKSDSNKYGKDMKFAKEANLVTIDHRDGTYSEYLHLGKNKVNVEKGQIVEEGDLLGYTGLSGCMIKENPHLHLNIAKIEDGNVISIPYASKLPKEKNKRTGLENVVGIIFIISITGLLIFISGITGNVIGTSNNNFYGLLFIFMSLIFGGILIILKKTRRTSS